MKYVLLVLMMFLMLTSVGLAEEPAAEAPTEPAAVVDVVVDPADPPLLTETVVTAEPKKATEALAPAKPSPAGTKEIPAIIKDLPDVPDIGTVTEIAEEEGQSWGPYGGVLVLLLAAVVGFIRIKKKKKKA